MLTRNARQRISARQALQHPWLAAALAGPQ
jgi:hypothetical protein